ncbi:D-3-phosphoglycerate dehydrogenase [Fictibacillus solisalsi]|uniref:D-3-phosphoglycerate dehydrogenase n=1 Tax=Fictibacillus solisalsi TaxID=459525 RepID=A0A1G9YI02_9BACL|nr:2-hydroxyacid dehydrogenase [Fictibacillus solisalsi]SDN08838.1 D-3-phosphoglycerate dehydrogenase [Fictibacillus solisalsi]
MKLLAISDLFIPSDVMENGLSSLKSKGIEIEVREWNHTSLEMLQKDNIEVETKGPEAVSVPEALYEGIEDFDMLIVHFAPVTKTVLQRAKKLQLVGVLRGGTENIDQEAAAQQNIEVLNTPGRNARAVAEFTLGMILSEVRNIARSHAALKQGNWIKDFPNSDAIPELAGKTVGIIGLGNIGIRLATYLHALECNIIVFDEYTNDIPAPYKKVDLDTLLRESDIVSLHLRLSKDTQHFIGQEELDQMKPSAVLINTARSGLIDEKALVQRLKEKKIMGAALDVFDHEPLDANDELVKLDNVTITTHIAGSTIDAFRNSPKQLAKEILNKLR